jgi:hypothetical protein
MNIAVTPQSFKSAIVFGDLVTKSYNETTYFFLVLESSDDGFTYLARDGIHAASFWNYTSLLMHCDVTIERFVIDVEND